MAYLARFIANCKAPKDERRFGALTGTEMSRAVRHIVYAVQHEILANEIFNLERSRSVKKSALFNLNLFLDDEKLMRVGGRLRRSAQSYDTKHQLVLPRHHMTTILIRELHEQNGHIGQQGLLSIVRQRFWPVGGRRSIRDVTTKCVRCYKCRPKPIEQFMGELPTHLLTLA